MSRLFLEIPGHRQNLKYIDDALLGFLQFFCVRDHKKVHFALHEAVINSIQQIEKVSCEGKKEMVTIDVTVDESQVVAEVRDWMGGIKSHKDNMVSGLRQDISQYAESGRGLLMIEQLVDTLSWECKADDEFVLRLEKMI